MSILRILIILFITTTLLYLFNWITFINPSNYFYEDINCFYSKIYLLLLIITLYKTTRINYFILLLLLPLDLIYRFSGILFCCTTPFDYTFELYRFFNDLAKKESILYYFSHLIIGFPHYGNLIILIILLLPKTIKEYFQKKTTKPESIS